MVSGILDPLNHKKKLIVVLYFHLDSDCRHAGDGKDDGKVDHR